jgi:hypothetical protein
LPFLNSEQIDLEIYQYYKVIYQGRISFFEEMNIFDLIALDEYMFSKHSEKLPESDLSCLMIKAWLLDGSIKYFARKNLEDILKCSSRICVLQLTIMKRTWLLEYFLHPDLSLVE